ncbi:MAG: signal peptidase II [Phycisphaerales bacterium]|jgi:signal peptidase II|nr:signal peptidase II [Phycisphaerales bacterium]
MMTPAWRSTKSWVILLSVMIVGFSLDISSKTIAFDNVAGQQIILERDQLLSNPRWSPIPIHESIIVIPPKLLNFRLVLNDGAVFGIGSQQRIFFIIFTFIALGIACWIFARHTSSKNTLAHIALGLVLGGGLGNLYDRIAIGRVRDFMHLLPDRHLPFGWSWPGSNTELFPWIFNTGDVLLLTGMGLLMIFFWKQPTQDSSKSTSTTSPEPSRTESNRSE